MLLWQSTREFVFLENAELQEAAKPAAWEEEYPAASAVAWLFSAVVTVAEPVRFLLSIVTETTVRAEVK